MESESTSCGERTQDRTSLLKVKQPCPTDCGFPMLHGVIFLNGYSLPSASSFAISAPLAGMAPRTAYLASLTSLDRVASVSDFL